MNPTRLVSGSQLTTGAVTYYTCPAKNRAIVKKATATNTSGTDRTITVYLVPTGGTAGAANTIVAARTVGAGKTVDLYDLANHVLGYGDTLQALASAGSAITFVVSGVEG